MSVRREKASLGDRAKMIAVRAMLKLGPALNGEPDGRAGYDAMLAKLPSDTQVSFEPAIIGSVSGWWCRPPRPGPSIILYLHGGAYVVGSAWAYRAFVSQLVARSGVSAFIADYGLAPERPFPAALEESLSVYRALVADFDDIALVGDSAGGGLAIALASQIAADPDFGGDRHPRCLALMSPWTDLSLSGDSITAKEDRDPLVNRTMLETASRHYLGRVHPTDPRASPLFGDLSALPPTLVHVGDDEMLLDDSLRLANLIEQQGGQVQAVVWDEMIHVFPSLYEQLGASSRALDDIADHLKKYLR